MPQNVRSFDSMDTLAQALAQAQAMRQTRVIFHIEKGLAHACSISRLRTLLDMLLPMVQARSGVVRHERDGRWYVNLSLRYREGVRMADARRLGDVSALSEAEQAALKQAEQLVAPCLSLPEAEKLVDELMTLENPYSCPHGRPTIIRISKAELEKKFNRIV